MKQVAKELQQLQKDPPEGIKIIVNDSDLTDIQALIEGPGILHKFQFLVKTDITDVNFTLEYLLQEAVTMELIVMPRMMKL